MNFIENNDSKDIANWKVKNLKDVLVERGIIENKRYEVSIKAKNFKNFI